MFGQGIRHLPLKANSVRSPVTIITISCSVLQHVLRVGLGSDIGSL